MSESIAFVQKGLASTPLIVLNSFGDEWKYIVEALDSLGVTSYSMLAVTSSEWNKDLSPWDADAVFKGEPDFKGGADEYLKRLTEEIIPETINEHGLKPFCTYIAGYSMAGLFALYSLYKTDVFNGAASCSGSLWFPGFRDYVFNNDLIASSSKIYMSLGDRESKTKLIRPSKYFWMARARSKSSASLNTIDFVMGSMWYDSYLAMILSPNSNGSPLS